MNAKTNAKTIVLASLATVGCLALSACGGGGGGGVKVASTPTPSPTPTPTPPAATPTANFLAKPLQSQEFPLYAGIIDAAGEVITSSTGVPRVRYDAAADRYDVMLPGGEWQKVVDDPYSEMPAPNTSWQAGTSVYLQNYTAPDAAPGATKYDFSSLTGIFSPTGVAYTAFGVPTSAANVPMTGSASFQGLIVGASNEIVDWGDWGKWNSWIDGTIDLAFNFAAGTLSGAINPRLYANDLHTLPSLAFSNTVYSTGSATFSGTFATDLSGANSFAGQFTGPAAQELIGNFVFPYISPETGQPYSATGAFVAKQ